MLAHDPGLPLWESQRQVLETLTVTVKSRGNTYMLRVTCSAQELLPREWRHPHRAGPFHN